MDTSLERLRRKLHYLCRRRATQELELILTRFWNTHAQGFSEQELQELEAILALDDIDLLAMCLGQKPFPESFSKDLTQRLILTPLRPGGQG